MKLILGKEGEPANALSLILTQLDIDFDRNLVFLHFASVQQLGQKFPLMLPLGEQVGRETGRIRQTSL